ncbi:MAG: aldo/keto reductase, partial [Clostridiales bacterium]|nr:aldo/keto reductase [Clostridiales bacterium]
MVDMFLEKGFTYFDTAYVYHSGKSEESLKKALVERYPRDKFTVTTKMPMFMVNAKSDLERIFNEQLRRLGVDFIDYYWLHALNGVQYAKVQRLDAFGFISEKKRQGYIRHIGFSYHDGPELLDKILTEHPETEYVQLQINYVDWDSPSVAAGACYEVAKKHNVPVIVMEPLKGGALANVSSEIEKAFKEHDPHASVASWGIRYAASLDNVLTVLSGMSTEEQVADNISYMENFVPLSDKEKRLVNNAAAIINDGAAVPCTACRYCVDGCPKKIAIPEYFALLNENKRMNGYSNGGVYYNNYILEGRGKASDCVKCGKCEKVCPQHLHIRDFLKDVAKTFE